MATREELKQVFANGQMATGEKFANLIDSMKVVQLPVVDPQALGTSLSFIDSISQDADGKITATKKTLDLANAHELNPFKGWYKTGDTLPTDGFDGAYLYFKDTSELTGQTTIYRWNGTAYADTGTVVDTSNVQTFETGQAVNGVAVKDIDGNNDQTAAGVLSAEAGSVLAENIFNYKEIDLSVYTPQGWIINNTGKWAIQAGTSIMVPVNAGEVYAIKKAGTGSAYIGVLASSEWPTNAGNTVSFATGFSSRIVINNNTEVVTIPEDGVALCIRMTATDTSSVAPDSVILKTGGTILEKKVSEIENFGSELIRVSEELPLDKYAEINSIIDGAAKWSNTSGKSIMVGVIPGDTYLIEPPNNITTFIAILSRDMTPYYNGQSVNNFATGYTGRIQVSGEPVVITMPDDGYYLNVQTSTSNQIITPKIIHIIKEVVREKFETIQHAATSEQNVDFMQYQISGRLGANSLEYLESGTSILVPVGESAIKEGDTINIICKLISNNIIYMGETFTVYETSKVYLSFLKEEPVIGQNVVTADNVSRHIFTDSTVGNSVVVPKGTAYILFVEYTSTTSTTSHAPERLTRMVGGIDSDKLVKGTFNSAYTEIDPTVVRNSFSGLIRGKNKIDTFLFFSDPHLNDNNVRESVTELVRDKYISSLQKHFNSMPLDFCICGGDWLNYGHNNACGDLGYSDAFMRKLFKRYYPVFGNHDGNPYNPTTTPITNSLNSIDYTSIKNLMFRENGETYYSFDGNTTKFYVFNSGVSFIKEMSPSSGNAYNTSTPKSAFSFLINNRWPQAHWIASKLIEDDADNSVMVIHIYANARNPEEWFATGTQDYSFQAYGIHELAGNIRDIVVAYNNRGSITLQQGTADEHSYDFSSCNGHVDFILCGHTHFDYVDVSGSIPIVCTTNLQGDYIVKESGSWVKHYDLVPTFDCCLIDNDDNGNTLYMQRVGHGVDRVIHFVPFGVTGTLELTPKLTGTLSWESRNTSVATVSDGLVTKVSAGYAGVVATDANGREEYFIVQCS